MAGTASSLCEMVAHIGSTSQQGAGALTFGSGSWNIDPLRENLSYRSRIINPDVITGVLQKHGERSRLGPSMVAGQIIKNVSPYDLDFIFQMLGTGAAGGAGSDEYELTGTADPKYFNLLKYLTIDQGTNQEAIEYYDCKLNRFVLRGQQATQGNQAGLALQGILDIIGKGRAIGGSAEVWDSSYGTRTGTAEQQSYLYTDTDNSGTTRLDITINAASYAITPLDFTLVWHNHLKPQWYNSLEFSALCPQGRTILVDMTLPWDTVHDALANETLANGDTNGTTFTLTFVNGDVSTTMNFRNFQWPNEDPTIPGKPGEVTFKIRGQAYGDVHTDGSSRVEFSDGVNTNAVLNDTNPA
jgi:hypothetical protein